MILWDKRGTGLSDRVAPDHLPTLEQRMDDLRAVMDAAGSERAVLFGISEGTVLSALFAASYPERTEALALYGGAPRWVEGEDYPHVPPVEAAERFAREVCDGWGDNALAAQALGALDRRRPGGPGALERDARARGESRRRRGLAPHDLRHRHPRRPAGRSTCRRW